MNTDGVLGELDRDVMHKIAAKYDIGREKDVCSWVSTLTEAHVTSLGDLRTGVVLCELINKLYPGSVSRINLSKVAFMQRENVSLYLNALKKLRFPTVDLFDCQDLYDNKNPVAVIDHLYALSNFATKLESFKGPFIGSKKREHYLTKVAIPSLETEVLQKPDVVPQKEFEPVLGALDRDVQAKISAKYSSEQENEVLMWIRAVLGYEIVGDSLTTALKSGKELCDLFNNVFGSLETISANKRNLAFFQRENISKYLEACRSIGMNPVDLFDCQDLYDGKNIVSVINHFYSLSGFAQVRVVDFKGPYIGIKYSNTNVREFTSEVLNKYAESSWTSGSNGALDPQYTAEVGNQIIRNLEHIENEKQMSKAKVNRLYGK